jgi:hypothetical protein
MAILIKWGRATLTQEEVTQFFLLVGSVADPDHFDMDLDPDPAFHFDTNPDPDPAFQFDTDPTVFHRSGSLLF